ncbi:MAG: hypothetical protein NC548_39680 [Lachnospiraceae bacterium]|nr:hypothetical protein [Lachnospiraceae bacterium]
MAKKKKPAPEQELQQYRESLMESYERWGEIKINGSNDPAWPDGIGLDLTRSHIRHYQFKIAETCMEQGWPYPPEMGLPVPPEAPRGYMAGLDQTERVERLKSTGYELVTEIGGGQFGKIY